MANTTTPARKAREPAAALPTTGMDYLRTLDDSALKLWSVTGPKERPGKIFAVLCEDTSKTYILHQMYDGKFSLFARVAIEKPAAE